MENMICRHLLTGQTAVVTGSSTGIGAAVAKGLALAGANVVVNFPHPADNADVVVDEIEKAGGHALGIQADISQEPEVTALFHQALEQYGAIDILVNNAGVQDDAPLTEMTLTQWQRVLDINLTGAFLCAREAARTFIRQGVCPERSHAAGKIIFISSVHELIPWAGHVNYAASKGGIMLLMKSMAQELAPHKIRINSIAPGAIKTRINRSAWQSPEAENTLIKLIPYGRVGEPVDIAQAAAWLASDESDYVHGTTIFVDGGMALYPAFAEGG